MLKDQTVAAVERGVRLRLCFEHGTAALIVGSHPLHLDLLGSEPQARWKYGATTAANEMVVVAIG